MAFYVWQEDEAHKGLWVSGAVVTGKTMWLYGYVEDGREEDSFHGSEGYLENVNN